MESIDVWRKLQVEYSRFGQSKLDTEKLAEVTYEDCYAKNGWVGIEVDKLHNYLFAGLGHHIIQCKSFDDMIYVKQILMTFDESFEQTHYSFGSDVERGDSQPRDYDRRDSQRHSDRDRGYDRERDRDRSRSLDLRSHQRSRSKSRGRSRVNPPNWDEDEDGLWKPPRIPNPKYKGPWKRKMYYLQLTETFMDFEFLIISSNRYLKLFM
ncbi:calreticulin-3-like [Chenopodium quinoa]|uniref:calreticulin-3-like n=1 Tax=Chenopodium quinoa TaxID=63459 RepID=UPI000B76D569|nr:calreticulin-3-like [Chenopodium quinoa]